MSFRNRRVSFVLEFPHYLWRQKHQVKRKQMYVIAKLKYLEAEKQNEAAIHLSKQKPSGGIGGKQQKATGNVNLKKFEMNGGCGLQG